ncbi:hypothetical protein BD408DRAFT_437356 [Parasitella parasitica]|nr:hypothetical protein BD408DRAFT_437356 [Parasitella parasitica]
MSLPFPPYVMSSLIKDSIAREYDISSLKMLDYSGSVIKCNLIKKAREQLGILVPSYYGLTEAVGMLTTALPNFGCWGVDGILSFCERHKGLIKYYKTQINPSQVEHIMIKHPKVADCAAIGVYQAELGTEFLSLYVKLIDGNFNSQEIIKELQTYSDDQLPEAKRVRAGIKIVDSFPRTSSGKIQRLALPQTIMAVPVAN